MMENAFWISILAFTGILLFIAGIYFLIRYRQERRGFWERIKRVAGGLSVDEGLSPAPAPSGTWKNHLFNFFMRLGEMVKPKKEGGLSHLQKKFLQAGFRGESAPIIFFGAKAFLAILLALIFSLVKLFTVGLIPALPFMLFSVSLALIGWYLPDVWLRVRISERKEKILQGFPDALDLMVVCVEAGIGLDAAILRVGEEMKLSNKALSEEFRLMSLELRAGKLRQDALRNLALRTDLEDVSSLVTLLIQTDRFGTGIGPALRVHSDSMRTRRHQRAEVIAAKVPVKLIFPLILFILPSLFVVIAGPAAINIFRILIPALAGR